jgi:hypothetical protein
VMILHVRYCFTRYLSRLFCFVHIFFSVSVKRKTNRVVCFLCVFR